MSIDRRILLRMIERGLRRQFGVPACKLPLFCSGYERYLAMRKLAETLIFHNAAESYVRKSPIETWRHIGDQKTLFNCSKHKGMPIGNLTSQFFGNVYLDALDQFIKHELKARHYIRYVDDMVLIHEDRSVLAGRLEAIEGLIKEKLLLHLNENATRLKPVSCGINFLGYIVHSTHRLARRRVVGNFESRLKHFERLLVHKDRESGTGSFSYDTDNLETLLAVINSYMAHLAKASSRSLLFSIVEKHAWLNHYFEISGFKAARTWKPPRDFPCLENQYGWFRRRWSNAAIFFQVGAYFELYGQDAGWAHRALGLKLLKPRFGNLPRVGIPAGLVEKYMKKTLAVRFQVLKVSETGYPLYRIKERFPAVQLHTAYLTHLPEGV